MLAELIACSIGEAGKGKAMRQKCGWQKWAGRRQEEQDVERKRGAAGDARASSTCCRVVYFAKKGMRIDFCRGSGELSFMMLTVASSRQK